MSQSAEGGYIASLYVGDLKPDIQENHLWNVFSGYGQILSVKICRDSTTGASLGYAYVNFRTLEEAEKAMTCLNFSLVEGKPCRIMWSMRDPAKRRSNAGNLFLKNIDPTIDSKALLEAFSVFGPIMSCKLATDDFGKSRGFGFIQFYSDADAETALEKVNGVEFMNKKILIHRFVPRAQRYGDHHTAKPKFTNIFVKNFGNEWDEKQLMERFSVYGKITSLVVIRDSNGSSRGFGFVNFESSEDASKAVDASKDLKTPSGQNVFVGRAIKKSERLEQLRQEFLRRKKEQIKKCQDLNVYVKPLEASMNDDQLKECFAKFGPIQSHKVMRDAAGRSRGFGFVCFTKPEDAQRAIIEMNGVVIGAKPLVVTIAQLREERRREMQVKRVNNPAQNGLFTGPNVPLMSVPQMGQGYPQVPVRYPSIPPSQRVGQRQPVGNMGNIPTGQRHQMQYQGIPFQQGMQYMPRMPPRQVPYGNQKPSMQNFQRNYQGVPGYFSAAPEPMSTRNPAGLNSQVAACNYVAVSQNEEVPVQNGEHKKPNAPDAVIVQRLKAMANLMYPGDSDVSAKAVNLAFDALSKQENRTDTDEVLQECLTGAYNYVVKNMADKDKQKEATPSQSK